MRRIAAVAVAAAVSFISPARAADPTAAQLLLAPQVHAGQTLSWTVKHWFVQSPGSMRLGQTDVFQCHITTAFDGEATAEGRAKVYMVRGGASATLSREVQFVLGPPATGFPVVIPQPSMIIRDGRAYLADGSPLTWNSTVCMFYSAWMYGDPPSHLAVGTAWRHGEPGGGWSDVTVTSLDMKHGTVGLHTVSTEPRYSTDLKIVAGGIIVDEVLRDQDSGGFDKYVYTLDSPRIRN